MASKQVSSPRNPSDHAVHQGREVVNSVFYTDEAGNPTGGYSLGTGFEITWQDGVKNPNGAIIEDVIETCLQRLRWFQESRFACRENALAITQLESAQDWLYRRTRERQARNVEGTYEK